MIRAIRARRMQRMFMYYAAMTAFFIGATAIARTMKHGHHHHCHGQYAVPESVAGKGIDEVVDAEEAELTKDTERYVKPLYKDAPQDQNVEI
jgi:acyl transferase domain-containing protein